MRFTASISSALFFFLSFAVLGIQSEFTCDSMDKTTEIEGEFNDIVLDIRCPSGKSADFLEPEDIMWQVHAIGDDEPAQYKVLPETSWIKPTIVDGSLLFVREENAPGAKGDAVETAIVLFIPDSMMKKVSTGFFTTNVEIIRPANSSNVLEIEHESGDVYVTSPGSPIKFLHLRIGLEGFLEANVGEGSEINIEGTDMTVHVKTPGGLKATLAGLQSKLLVEGAYESIELASSALDVTILVNSPNGCDGVTGIANDNGSCSETEDTVTVAAQNCPISTKLGDFGCVVGKSGGASLYPLASSWFIVPGMIFSFFIMTSLMI